MEEWKKKYISKSMRIETRTHRVCPTSSGTLQTCFQSLKNILSMILLLFTIKRYSGIGRIKHYRHRNVRYLIAAS